MPDPRIYKKPFAHSGDTEEPASTVQANGKMSYPEGWGYAYQRPKSDPQQRPLGRKEVNGTFKEVTQALGEMQQFGFANWQDLSSVGGWPEGARVQYTDGRIYVSTSASNTTEPTQPGANWDRWHFDLATSAEATDWTSPSNSALMTPQRFKDALQGRTLSDLTPWDNASGDESLLEAQAWYGAWMAYKSGGNMALPNGIEFKWGRETVSKGTAWTTTKWTVNYTTNFSNVYTVLAFCEHDGSSDTGVIINRNAFHVNQVSQFQVHIDK